MSVRFGSGWLLCFVTAFALFVLLKYRDVEKRLRDYLKQRRSELENERRDNRLRARHIDRSHDDG